MPKPKPRVYPLVASIFVIITIIQLRGKGKINTKERLYVPVPLAQTMIEPTLDETQIAESDPDPEEKNEDKESPFAKALLQFPLENLLVVETVEETRVFVSQFLSEMLPFLIMEPPHPVNSSCVPPPLGNVCESQSRLYQRKVGVLIQFGFDADILEIHLNELYDVVDKFFITESTKAHFLAAPKPLLWETIRDQDRFKRFSDKIVHFVVDDAENSGIPNDLNLFFTTEKFQEKLRWEKFMEWNNASKYFQDDDLLGFGDTDEIPSRATIFRLKTCHNFTSKDHVDIGIWFPYGLIYQAFRPDYPPKQGYNQAVYALGDPTYWTLAGAKKYAAASRNVPSRMRGKSSNFVLGGMHMSNYRYLPHGVTKGLTQSEAQKAAIAETIRQIRKYAGNGEAGLWELQQTIFEPRKDVKKRIVAMDTLRSSWYNRNYRMEEIAVLPWFYDCNRQRYPTWEGKQDPRVL